MFSFYLTGFKKLLDIGKKIILVLTVYFVVVSLFLYFIAKDKPKVTYDPVKKNREEVYKAINDPQLNKTQEGKLAITLYRVMLCGLIGEACTDNPADGDKNFSHSIFGFMTNLITLPYVYPPASGMYWAYSGLQNASFIPKTYAAEGIGFAAIKPLMSIWKVFRDLSYMILVLVLIAIGFMIMFRAKINPQTVISVENSLPKIVVALLLITFSFPIAGFLIDLMYISIGIIAVIFSSVTGLGENLNSPTKILNYFYFSKSNQIWELTNPLNNSGDLWNLAASIFGILPDALRTIIDFFVFLILPPGKIVSSIFHFFAPKVPRANILNILPFLKRFSVFEKYFNDAGSGTPLVSVLFGLFFLLITLIFTSIFSQFIGQIIIIIILSLSLIYLFFRLFFMLLHAYLQVLLLIIFSPVILMVEMIPGKSTFSSWIKNLILNLATWPILIIFVLIIQILLNQPADQYSNLWAPPFLLSINPEYFKTIISMGILFMAPDLIKNFKQLSGVKPMPIGINLGAFTAGAGASFGAGIGMLSQFHTLSLVFGREGIGRTLISKIFPSGKRVADAIAEAVKKSGGSSGNTPQV